MQSWKRHEYTNSSFCSATIRAEKMLSTKNNAIRNVTNGDEPDETAPTGVRIVG